MQKASTLQQKLTLLRHLRDGNIMEAQKMLAKLSKVARTNPELYEKFHDFISQHQEQIIEMETNQKVDEKVEIIHTDADDIDDSPANSDQEFASSSGSEEEDQQSKAEEIQNIKFKDLSNIKGGERVQKCYTEDKKVFNVPTKPSQCLNNGKSSVVIAKANQNKLPQKSAQNTNKECHLKSSKTFTKK